MMTGRRFIAVLLLLCSLLLPSVSAAGAQSGEPGLPALLARVPSSAFGAGWLSYVNIPALIRGTPGAVIPQSAQDVDSLQSGPGGEALLRAYQALAAGPSDLYRHLYRWDALAVSSGIDFFVISEALEMGQPPARQIWLRGAFDRTALLDRLKEKGYQASAEAFPAFEVWGRDGMIDGGQALDLLRRDPAFLFGGYIGQSWPAALSGDLLFTSPDEAAIRAAAEGTAASLSSLGPLKGLVSAADKVSPEETGELAQLYLLTPDAAGLSALSPWDAPPAVPLPAYTLFSLSQAFALNDEWVLIGLSYPDGSSAAAAKEALTIRYASAILTHTGEKLSDRVAAMGGEAGEPFVMEAEDGSSAVILPLRFSTLEGNAPMAFRFFVNLLLSRELAWLTAGQ